MTIVDFLRKVFVLLVTYFVPSAKMDAKAITDFSYKFCHELNNDTNMVASPLSAEILLGLLALGSSDAAHTELLTALSLSDDNAVRAVFSECSKRLNVTKGVTLNVANKVYIKHGDYDLAPQLKEDAIKVFDASIELINFGQSEAAARTINSWVESKTNNHIKDLIKSDALSNDTRLVLVNALYFKGSWKKKFDPENTHTLPFFVTDTKTVNVPMMTMTDEFAYGQSRSLNAKMLEMSYEGDGASMLIVLPDERGGLKQVMQALAGGHDLASELKEMFKTKVDVGIPKFKIETEINLKELLPKLGVNQIFNAEESGLTRMLSKDERLFVSHAVQKAYIEVNEEGATAAAATGIVMMLRCARMNPSFNANRPFVFMLLGEDKTPLFTGTFHGN